jgi:hypothetical protein
MSHRKTDLGIPSREKSAKVVLAPVAHGSRGFFMKAGAAPLPSIKEGSGALLSVFLPNV